MTSVELKEWERIRDEEFYPLLDKENKTELEEHRLEKLRIRMIPYKLYLKRYFEQKYGWTLE